MVTILYKFIFFNMEDKMKKIISFISFFLLLSAAAVAEITAKKTADGKLEVTFFYGNPRAEQVLLAADFTNFKDGALPMTKTDKGFTLTQIFDPGTSVKYKFIVDDNWTTDLRAPDFVDDGFGGKNSFAELDSLVADAGGAEKADEMAKKKGPKVQFQSWTILGMQTKFSTQDKDKKSKKETKADNVALGFKSYNKLTGDLTGNMPFYLEIATGEQDYEDAKVKLYDRALSGKENGELVKEGLGHLISDPITYLADGEAGKWKIAPYLGHFKFGWNTPYVNYTTGYIYAKLPARKEITWNTIADNWDAGYDHVGGYNLFENGAKWQKIGDNTLKVGVNFNKSADRKGNNFGSYAFVTFDAGMWKIDAQWNTMFGREFQFYEPIENDIIIGAKAKIADISIAAQGLIAIHNMSTEDLVPDPTNGWAIADVFGYSTDVFYRSGKFDGIENLAGNITAGYKNDKFNINAEYRFRGMEASMLYVRNNHDDNDHRLRNMLGSKNTQQVTLKLGFNPMEALSLGLKTSMETELKHYGTSASNNKFIGNVMSSLPNGYAGGADPTLFDKFGAEFGFTPSVTYKFDELLGFKSSINAYGIMSLAAYRKRGALKDYEYSSSDSKFAFKYAGLAFKSEKLSDVVGALDVYYGLDNSKKDILGNTLIARVALPLDMEVTGGIGIRSVKGTKAAKKYVKENLNPFGFALGFAKKLHAVKSPKVYAQFMWNMDIYKGFGDGPTELNLSNGANLGKWGYTKGLDRYDGAGALRVGLHWNF